MVNFFFWSLFQSYFGVLIYKIIILVNISSSKKHIFKLHAEKNANFFMKKSAN